MAEKVKQEDLVQPRLRVSKQSRCYRCDKKFVASEDIVLRGGFRTPISMWHRSCTTDDLFGEEYVVKNKEGGVSENGKTSA